MTISDPRLVYSNHNFTEQLEALRQADRKGGNGTPAAAKKDEKLYKVCVEFESLFIKQMLDVMRKTVEKTDFLHGGMAEDIFEDMLYDKYSLLMAKNSGFGVADMIYRQLTPQESGIITPLS
jgi:Rod binding domain-containing protein